MNKFNIDENKYNLVFNEICKELVTEELYRKIFAEFKDFQFFKFLTVSLFE